jgi:hypothetical protein
MPKEQWEAVSASLELGGKKPGRGGPWCLISPTLLWLLSFATHLDTASSELENPGDSGFRETRGHLFQSRLVQMGMTMSRAGEWPMQGHPVSLVTGRTPNLPVYPDPCQLL